MKILLIDDDYNILEVIREAYDWLSYGFENVYLAYNVSSAKKEILQNNPDVILSDIEMPGGSGIELLQWVREGGYQCEFIFLTCHEKFAFAEKAIELGVSGYVTKPFSKEKTMAVIEKARDKILNSRKLFEIEKENHTWEEMHLRLEENFWRGLLFFRITPKMEVIIKEIKKQRIPISADVKIRLVLVSILKTQINADWDPDTFQYAIRNICDEILLASCDVKSIIGYDSVSNYYIGVIVNENEDVKKLESCCKRICDSIHKYLSCFVTCFISLPIGLCFLASTRHEMEKRDRINPVVEGTILFHDEAILKEEKRVVSLDFPLYISYFEAGNHLKIVSEVQNTINYIIATEQSISGSFQALYHDFSQIIYLLLHNHEIQAHMLFEDNISQMLSQNALYSVFDMMKWVNYITERSIAMLNEVKNSENIVTKAKRFIHEHYAEEIGRNEIAESVYITPDYLTKLFKSEIRMSVNDYLIQYRIGRANEFLKKGNQSISDIAAIVGFNSISYFSTVFKKVMGCSPNEARRNTYEDQR